MKFANQYYTDFNMFCVFSCFYSSKVEKGRMWNNGSPQKNAVVSDSWFNKRFPNNVIILIFLLESNNYRVKTSKAGLLFKVGNWSSLSLYSLHYAEAYNEFAGPIFASLRQSNSASFEEMLQRWRAVGNIVFDLIGPRFEPQTSRYRDERVTAHRLVER